MIEICPCLPPDRHRKKGSLKLPVTTDYFMVFLNVGAGLLPCDQEKTVEAIQERS